MQPHIHLDTTAPATRVLTCGSPERAAWVAREFLADARPLAANREYHSYAGRYRNQTVLVISHGVGAPGAAICFRELFDIGAQTIIRLGTAGGFRDDCAIGDVVIAEAAARRDGASNMMAPPDFPAIANGDLTSALARHFIGVERVSRGIVVTSDLFYAEKVKQDWELYRDCGAIAIEMECAALFVQASIHRRRAAAVLLLDGNALKHDEGAYDPRSAHLKARMKTAAQKCLDALSEA